MNQETCGLSAAGSGPGRLRVPLISHLKGFGVWMMKRIFNAHWQSWLQKKDRWHTWCWAHLSDPQCARQQWPILRFTIRNMIVKEYKYLSAHPKTHEVVSGWHKWSHAPDEHFFTLLTSCLPATVFLEFWKRRRAVLAYDWDLVDWEEEEVKYLLTADGCEKESAPQSAIHNNRDSRHKPLLSSHLKASRWMKYVAIESCNLSDALQKVNFLLDEWNWLKRHWIM